MADAHHLKKSNNCDVSATDLPIVTKFGIIVHQPSEPRQPIKFREFEIQDGGSGHFEKTKMAISLRQMDQFRQNLTR